MDAQHGLTVRSVKFVRNLTTFIHALEGKYCVWMEIDFTLGRQFYRSFWAIHTGFGIKNLVQKMLPCFTNNRMSQECRINESRWLFSRHFWPLLKQATFFMAVGRKITKKTVYIIGLGPHSVIYKLKIFSMLKVCPSNFFWQLHHYLFTCNGIFKEILAWLLKKCYFLLIIFTNYLLR